MLTDAIWGTWRGARPGGGRARERRSLRAWVQYAELTGGARKGRDVGGWGHSKVHNGADCAKYQNLARELPREEVERAEERSSSSLEWAAYAPLGVMECRGNRGNVLTHGGCRGGTFRVLGISTGGSLGGGLGD